MDFLEKVDINGETRKYRCNICQKISPHSSTMRRHMLRRHGEPTYDPCPYCGKTFKFLPNLEEHMRAKKCIAHLNLKVSNVKSGKKAVSGEETEEKD